MNRVRETYQVVLEKLVGHRLRNKLRPLAHTTHKSEFEIHQDIEIKPEFI